MANLCGNKLVFLGKTSVVEEAYTFLKTCEKPDPSSERGCPGLDFNLIVQEPEGLLSINDPATDDVKNQLIRQYGFWNIYEWRTANWGQRWNFLEIHHEVPPQSSDSKFESEARVHFDSAWSPVLGIAAALSARFPDVAVILVHEEAGNDEFGAEAYFRGDTFETIHFSAGPLLADIDEDEEWAAEIESERIRERLSGVERELVLSLERFILAKN